MEWNDRYAIGIEEIDNQHKALFRAVNRVVTIVESGDLSRNQRACAEALIYLKNYTFTHFQTEEAYQQSINYPRFEEHKQIHYVFRTLILEFEKKFAGGPLSREAVMGFIQILTDWLVHHIMYQDQLIARSLETQ